MGSFKCLLLVALCVVGARGFMNELEVDEHLNWLVASREDTTDDDYGMMNIMEEFDIALNGITESPGCFRSSGSLEAPPKDCPGCLKEGIRGVMRTAGRKLKEKCEKTECPRIKEMCIRAAANKEITLGYLIYKVRPVTHGLAYCFGSSSCNEQSAKDVSTNVANILVDALNLTRSGKGPFDFLSGTREFLDTVDLHAVKLDLHETRHWIPVENRRDQTPPTHGRHGGGDDDSSHGKGKYCETCIGLTIREVMKHVTRSVIRYCTGERTKNARVKQWCQAGESNPKESFGVLLAATEPWKFSSGYCIGKGFCKVHGGHDSHRMKKYEE